MTESPERVELQRKILEIDRKMGLEMEQVSGRVGRLRVKDYSFPWMIWGLTALCFAWYAFGSMFIPEGNLPPDVFKWGFYAGLLGIVIGIWKTFLWMFRNVKSKVKKKGPSVEESEELQALRQEKRKLMNRLEEIKKMER